MNPSRRDAPDEPQPEEEEGGETERLHVEIPPCSDEPRMINLARVAEMYYM